MIITSLALCQLLSGQTPPPRGNQLGTPPPSASRETRQLRLPGLEPGAPISIEADTITAVVKPGRTFYTATGSVVIRSGELRFSADRMSYDSASGEATAQGHLAFDDPREQTHIEGTHGNYNFPHSTGEFDDFQGVSGIELRGPSARPVSNNPLIFSGKRLLRLGPDHYRLEDGRVTSCTLPHPKWELTATRADIELGQNARLYHAAFRLFDVPIFFAPYLSHSTTRLGRHSGVLVPVVSHSNIKGYVVGDSFYWAAARNLNVTAGAELLTARGWADHLRVDARPTRNSALGIQLDGVLDRGLTAPGGGRLHQGGQELRITGNHQSESGIRTVLNVDYLSSYLYRLVFNNSFADAINSEAVSTAFSEKQTDGRDWNVVAHRYQNFLGSGPNTSLSLASLPTLDWNAYAQAITRRLPLYFSWDFDAGLLDRSEPGFSTGIMKRVDLAPQVRMPLNTPVGHFTATAGVQSSFYSERQNAAATLPANAPPQLLAGTLWRNSAGAGLEWRPPALERIYQSPWKAAGKRLKHVFEPRLGYHFTGGVHDPNEVIRFDASDILTNTSELEYGFTNRLISSNGVPGQSHEIASWTLLQKYFFHPDFNGALVPGARNVMLTTLMLSPFSIEALPLRFSPISSVLRVSPFSRFDGNWRLDYDGHDHHITASAFTGNFHFGQGLFFSGSQYMLRPPPELDQIGEVANYNQLRLATGYGSATAPGFSIAGAAAYDERSGRLQYTTLQITHNWDCCGFSIEYRRFSLATVRRENQFLVSFSLANVATFGNLRRQDRLF